MPRRLPLLIALLLLSALLLTAAVAHGDSSAPETTPLALEEPLEDEAEEAGEEETAECELAEEEVAEGELSQDEADEICDEEEEARPAARPHQDAGAKHGGGHRSHKHKKPCRHKAAAHKHRCPHRSR